MAIGNITVGTLAITRVDRNAIEVEVIAIADGGTFLVRNRAGKEFKARRLDPMPVETLQIKRLSLMAAAIRVLQGQPKGGSAQYPRDRKTGSRTGILDADRSENARTDALRRNLPRDRHEGASPNRQEQAEGQF
ncbi:hypothetical protein SDC9_91021 [bioreactor metagenome]|uniref:Uncharacterized protein n=1 Tax=bioreactor metagenome TaxID=1076179 RepID=A0A645A0G1_9ZZZZ